MEYEGTSSLFCRIRGRRDNISSSTCCTSINTKLTQATLPSPEHPSISSSSLYSTQLGKQGNFRRVSTTEEPSACPFPGLAANVLEMRVKEGSKIRNLLGFVVARMQSEGEGVLRKRQTELRPGVDDEVTQTGLRYKVDDGMNRTGLRRKVDDVMNRTGLRREVDDVMTQTGIRYKVDDVMNRTGLRHKVDDGMTQTRLRYEVDDVMNRTGLRHKVDDGMTQTGLKNEVDDSLTRTGLRHQTDDNKTLSQTWLRQGEGILDLLRSQTITRPSQEARVLDSGNRKRTGQRVRQVVFTGSARGITKTISCVEILKRKLGGLHQLSMLQYRTVNEVWESLEPDAKPNSMVTVQKTVPAISILLSKDPLDPLEPGYQAPETPPKPGYQPPQYPTPDHRFATSPRVGSDPNTFCSPTHQTREALPAPLEQIRLDQRWTWGDGTLRFGEGGRGTHPSPPQHGCKRAPFEERHRERSPLAAGQWSSHCSGPQQFVLPCADAKRVCREQCLQWL